MPLGTFPGDLLKGEREFSGGPAFLMVDFLAKKFWNWLRVLFHRHKRPEKGIQDWELSSNNGRKDKRGRPTTPDNFLLGSRNQWVWLLEQSWFDIGWLLVGIRSRRTSTIQDVQKTMMSLKEKPNGGLAAAFYRDSSEAADAMEIRRNRARLSELHAQILETQAKRDGQERQCWETEAALKEADPNEKEAIQTEAKRRKEYLIQLAENLRKLESDRDALNKKMLDQEAHFSRSELLDFLLSGRYAINPRNMADALAGLPFMKWRQSYSRCSKMPYDSEPHLWYRVLETIQEIWERRSEEFEDAPVEFFRARLLNLPKKLGYVRQFLWENWRDLKLAIEECWKSKHPAPSIPFVVTAKFVQNLTRPKSPVEKVLADREKLISPQN